ncbi:MAG TPA: DUF5668 domain-containing protein [Candidatus Sulfomarinibacteraceae bacterium]|nr:DUF5668 domain-containing protein [Candidatus Sulfomarinibacteraceae bacterium]
MTTPTERPDLPPDQPVPSAPPAPGADLRTSLEGGARVLDERAHELGREAEAAVSRLGANPALRETADLAGRLWGLVLLGFGIWFLLDVTLRMDLPPIAWGQLWPVVLIVLGVLIVVRGMARRA